MSRTTNVEEEEENPHPSRSTHHLDPHEVDSTIIELREDFEHKRGRCYTLNHCVRNHRKECEADRAKGRADNALEKFSG